MEGIQISVEAAGGKRDIDVVKITGYIDTTTSSELERVIQGLLREQRYKIIIDLGSVDYISSAGWGIFISEIKNIRTHKGDLKLANMSETVTEVYELLEFSTILTSSPSVPEAVSSFGDNGAPKPAAPARPGPAARPPAGRPAPKPAAPARPAAAPTPPPRPAPAPRPASAPQPAPAKPAAPAPAPAATPAAAPRPAAQPASMSASGGLLPLIDRVRAVVQAHPDWSAWKIKKELNQRRGNQPKVGWGEVRAELKYNDLGSKAARFKFARGK